MKVDEVLEEANQELRGKMTEEGQMWEDKYKVGAEEQSQKITEPRLS